MNNKVKKTLGIAFLSLITSGVFAQEKNLETPSLQKPKTVKLNVPKAVKPATEIDKPKPEVKPQDEKEPKEPKKPKVYKHKKLKRVKMNGKAEPNPKAYENANDNASFKKETK